MDMDRVVGEIKSEMARRCGSGKASRVRGIIVSPSAWAALQKDSEKFQGVLGVSNEQGNRWVRYSFYVLENKHFPKQGDHFFFVPYTKEKYTERFLGREEEYMERGDRVESFGSDTATVLNEITGFMSAGGRYLYDVDCKEVIDAARSKSPEERNAYFGELCWHGQVNNPPETKWIGKPETYDYHRTTHGVARGRILLHKDVRGAFAIIGIGVNGFQQLIEVVDPMSVTKDVDKFAQYAVGYFLPEEVSDFFAQFNVSYPVDQLQKLVAREYWEGSYDPEGLGRLALYHGYSDGKKCFQLTASFLSTRGWTVSLTLAEVDTEEQHEALKAKHFPPDWDKWPETSQDRAFEAIARSL